MPLVNHSRNIPAIPTPLPGLWLASMSQVYPWDRGTNYAVRARAARGEDGDERAVGSGGGQSMQAAPRWLFIAGVLVTTVVFLAAAVLAWGPWREFLANPARLGLLVSTLLLTASACCSDISLSGGRREDRSNRWIFVPFVVYGALVTWLPPFTDSRDILTLDGDALRFAGLLVFVVGGVLRVAPMFVLGRRFSPLVAIQEQHELATHGLYGVIRHPSYLGAGLTMLGWTLVFRSGLGLLLMPIAVWLGVARMDAEEALLASEFGEAYAAYRRRTWRLVPFLY